MKSSEFFSFRYRLFVARHPRPRVRSVMGLCEPDSEIVRGTLGRCCALRAAHRAACAHPVPASLCSSYLCPFNVGRRLSVSSRARRMSISLAQMLSS